MERYLTQARMPRGSGAVDSTAETAATTNMTNMAAAEHTRGVPLSQDSLQPSPTGVHPSTNSQPEGMDTTLPDMTDQGSTHKRIAKAVAALLSPTITAAVERAVAEGMQQLRKEIGEHAARLSMAEHRISSMEDDQHNIEGVLERFTQDQQRLHERMEDLENRSRRNNLRVVGLPETYKQGSLMDIC